MTHVNFVLCAIAYFVWSALRTYRGEEYEERASPALSPFVAPLCAVATLGLGIAWLALVREAAGSQRPVYAWFASLPVAVVNDRPGTHVAAWIEAACAATALLESLAAWLLYRAFDGTTKAGRVVIGACAVALVAADLFAPAVTSGDLYSYVGYTLIPARPYDPPAVPFGLGFAAINHWWGVPIPASPYGPVTLEIDRLAAWPFGTLLGKIIALRIVGIASLVAVCRAFRSIASSRRLGALVALSPALAFAFVANVHADLIGVACILWAIAIVARSRVVAVSLAVGAGLVKLPLVVVGALAFARLPNRIVRLACFATTIVATIGISYAFGGARFYSAVHSHAALYGYGDPLRVLYGGPLAVPKLLAVLGLVAAVGFGVWIDGTAWLLACLSGGLFPWYCAAALVFAAHAERAAAIVLIVMPLAMLACDGSIGNGPADTILFTAIFAVLAALIVRDAFGVAGMRRPR